MTAEQSLIEKLEALAIVNRGVLPAGEAIAIVREHYGTTGNTVDSSNPLINSTSSTENSKGNYIKSGEIRLNEPELIDDLASYLDGFEKLSKNDCKRWAQKIMVNVLRPYLRTTEPVMSEWQPIGTAPKDGKPILLYGGGFQRATVGCWSVRHLAWTTDAGTYEIMFGWMPLPKLPGQGDK